MYKKSVIAAIALTIAASAMVSSDAFARGGKGNDKDPTDIENLIDGQANGGPWVEGNVAPYSARHKVCQFLDTPVYNNYGEREVVKKKTCWFE